MLSINLILENVIDSESYINGQVHHQLECLKIWISLLTVL